MKTNDFKAVSEMYKQIKDVVGNEVMEKCIAEGKAATASWRNGSVNGDTSFGPSRKLIHKCQLEATTKAELAIFDANGLQKQVDTTIDSAISGGDTVANTLTTLISVNRTVCKRNYAQSQQEELDIKQFRDANSQACRDEVAEAATTDVSRELQCFQAAPPPATGVTCLEYNAMSAAELAGNLCDYCENGKLRQGNIMRCIDARWSHLHREIDGSESEASSEPDPETLDGCCYAHKMCVCSVEGQRVLAMKNRFLRIMKDTFRLSTHKDWRGFLAIGRIFVHLRPSMPSDTPAAEAAELAEQWGLDTDNRYLHISHHCFAPYDPLVEFAAEATEEEAIGAGRVDPELALKVSMSINEQGI